uniref:uncharacterized protein LOC120346976 n=1 Tax=Styela clava TaxID=7725 RepID=UPI00193A6EA5|nr:uncharacterized protein LOC120346976 [Styela clava]
MNNRPSPVPKGERGLPGEKGDSGIVNSDKTKAIIQEIVNAGMDKMADIVEERILEKLRNQTENDATTEDTTTVIATTQGLSTEECSVVYNSKCFRAIVYDTRNYNVTLSVAESICENKLANMYDITHYLRPMIPDGWLGIYVRTGMTYKLGQLYSTTGYAIFLPTEVWNPFFTYSDASFTTVAVLVERNPEDKDQGIFNARPSDVYHGAICENDL